ncbi:23 kDa integral membrane protein-like [Planococcus citri]|uniref:23 kDa integral membrane protein-like n=1 Tax=Planococcus citri TaxID=170843 RepID=UPI0031F9DC83
MWRRSSSLYKSFLLLLNFTFVVSSILLMCAGLIIRGQYFKYHEFLNEHYFSLPFMLICISGVMILITFFGCCGAIQENHCMISMFAAMLGVLFVMETTLGFAAYALSEKTSNVLRISLNDTMQLYNKSEELTKVWDGLQINLHCCGMDSYEDWYPILNGSLPMTCCKPQIGAIGKEMCNETVSSLYRSSCLTTLAEIIKSNATTLGAVGIGIAVAQILGVCFSCVLAKRIKNNYETFD